MSKYDELMKAGANIDESMGAGPVVMTAPTSTAPSRWRGVVRSKDAVLVPTDRLVPDADQPREDFDDESLDRLAESMKSRGQLQPIRVRWDEGRDSYVIVCGERRWRAATRAGLPALSCVVMDGPLSPEDLLSLQLVENCLREDLKPVEQARAFRSLMDRNGWSTRRLASELSIAQTNVVRSLSLLDLPDAVQEQVDLGNLATSTALEIGKLGDREAQERLAARAASEKLTRVAVAAPSSRRHVIKLPGAMVVVTLSDPKAEVLDALRRAIEQFRGDADAA
jgi:ParB family transcriptional regulator, chromosome partitioning protein